MSEEIVVSKKTKIVGFLKKAVVPVVVVLGLVGAYLVSRNGSGEEAKTTTEEVDTATDPRYEMWSFLLKDNEADGDGTRQILGTKVDCEAVVNTLNSERFQIEGEPERLL